MEEKQLAELKARHQEREIDEKQQGREVDPYVMKKLKEAMEKGLLPSAGFNEMPEAQASRKISRQERREKERSAKKFTSRNTFSKQEVEAMNQHSYEHGTAFALWSAAKILGLGEVRLDRIRMEIKALELQHFYGATLDPLPFDVAEVNLYKGALANGGKGKGKQ
jgi:hypothetical protein